MSGDAHVRFCEGLGVKFPAATLQLGPDLAQNGRIVAVQRVPRGMYFEMP